MKRRLERYRTFLSNAKPFREFCQEICQNSKKSYFPLNFMIDRKIKGEYIIGGLSDIYTSPNPRMDYISYKMHKQLKDINIPNDWSILGAQSDEYIRRMQVTERDRAERFLCNAAVDFEGRGDGYFFPIEDKDLEDLILSYTNSLKFAKIYTEFFTPDVPILKPEYRYKYLYCKKSFFGRILTVKEHQFYLECHPGRLNFHTLIRFQQKEGIKFEDTLRLYDFVMDQKEKLKTLDREPDLEPINYNPEIDREIVELAKETIVRKLVIVKRIEAAGSVLGSEDFRRLRLEHTTARDMHREVPELEAYIREFAAGSGAEIDEEAFAEFINLINNPDPDDESEGELEFFF
jgi:hypothetical protein